MSNPSEVTTRLDEIRQRLEDTTFPAPWELGTTSTLYMSGQEAFVLRQSGTAGVRAGLTAHRPDAEFIAHARADVEWLLDRIDAVRELIEAEAGMAIRPFGSRGSRYFSEEQIRRRLDGGGE